MLDALTLDQMRVFVAVAETGSFRAAARRVARAQSAVSHAIGNLESVLGSRLFDRSSRRPALTPEGTMLLADVQAILLKVDSMRARARGLKKGVELSLPLVVDTLFPLPTLGAALRDLREAYPSVTVRLSVEALGGPLAALRERRCALGIMAGEDFRDPRIEFRHVASFSLISLAAPSHPLAVRARRKEPIEAGELADHLQIVLEDPTPLSEGRNFGVLSPGTWRVSSQDAKHALILAGLGWGRLPEWQVARDIADGRLVRLHTLALGRHGATEVEAYVARRTDEPLGPAAQFFQEALLRRCAEGRTPKARGSRKSRGKARRT